MNKTECLNYYCKDSETRNFFASSLDKAQQAQRHGQGGWTGFFSPEEAEDFTHILRHINVVEYYLWLGGYTGATRTLCYFPPTWQEEMTEEEVYQGEDCPFTVLKGTCYSDMGHSDVLGSLMGLGMTRRKIGDILVRGNQCQVIVRSEITPLLQSQWERVGRQSITLEVLPLSQLEIPEVPRKEITSTVATLRLDSLVATGFSMARSKASGLISGGSVSINHRECKKGDKLLVEGDVLVCRGYGKCVLTEVKGESRKGRMIVTLEKYV